MNNGFLIKFFPFSGEPRELASLAPEYQEAYRTALRDGVQTVHQSRVMIVGHYGAGKTSLLRCLLGKPFVKEHIPTIGINADPKQTKVRTDEQADGDLQVVKTKNWTSGKGKVFVIPQTYRIIFFLTTLECICTINQFHVNLLLVTMIQR